jgi:hypothetical protein
MTTVCRRLLFGLVLLGTQLSAGCYLGYTNRPVVFPGVAYAPAYARAGVVNPCLPCGPTCYREFGPAGCGGSLFPGQYAGYGVAGPPAVSGPVTDAAPIGYDVPVYGSGYPAAAGTPGCVGCGAGGGIPIAGTPGGPPIAVTPPAGGPVYGVPFDSGAVPTLKPPPGSVPLQMPNEVKESKKVIAAGR